MSRLGWCFAVIGACSQAPAAPLPPVVVPVEPAAIAAPGPWKLVGDGKAPVQPVFEPGAAPTAVRIVADPVALAKVARRVLAWFDADADPVGLVAGLPGDAGVTVADVRRTLGLLADLAEADAASGEARLADPAFVASKFRYVTWRSDTAAAAARGIRLEPDEVRLTSYAAFRFSGRPSKEAGFDAALYAVPDDEAGLDAAAADARSDLLRDRYSRKEVLDGVYEPGGAAAGRARALVWLPRAAVHEALMQGTVVVSEPGRPDRTFNVHRHNHRAWRPELRATPEAQERLWYFREVGGLLGWGTDDKIQIEPGVTVAGDVANLGLGKLLLLTGPDSVARLVVLADSGGAFAPNLFQLDLLAGVYDDRAAWRRGTTDLPERVRAGILVAR